jgi:hypothetical protein
VVWRQVAFDATASRETPFSSTAGALLVKFTRIADRSFAAGSKTLPGTNATLASCAKP